MTVFNSTKRRAGVAGRAASGAAGLTGDGAYPLALTGGTGLVGGAILHAADGPVRALCRRAPDGALAGLHGVDWVRGDLADEPALDALCEGARVLLHVAGATASPSDRGFHAVNVAGTARVVTAARRAGVRRVVLVSSQAASRPGLSRYAASKAMGEAAARRAAGDGVELCVVRPPAVFGPGDEATKPILSALSRGVLPVPGGRGWADRRFALVTADDLARALLRVAAEGGDDLSVPASYPALGWADLAAAAGPRVRTVPVPPALLRLAGMGADIGSRLTGRASVFGSGKAAEMVRDWRAEGPALARTSLAEALRPLLITQADGGARLRNPAGAKAT